MKREVEKKFKAKIDELYILLHFVRDFISELSLDEKASYDIELAAEEAFLNIIDHGVLEESNEIKLYLEKTADELIVTFIDEGTYFDPVAEVNKRGPVDPSQEGYGLYCMVHAMDRIDYKRENNSNRLSMRKRLKN